MKKPAFMRNALGRRLVSAVAGAVFAGFGVAALAGDLSVSGNSVTITWTGGGAGAKTITTGGIVGDVASIPNTVGGIGFPNFAFTLQQSGVANGTYNFAAGFIIDEVNTSRRVEVYLPNVTMTFSGGVLTGSITSGQTVSVRGRNADNTLSAVATLSNNTATFDGATLTFNASNQLSKLNAAGGILADVAATILNSTDASYTYAVYLNQTSGPDNIRFISNGTTTAYPCSNGSEFVINAGSSLVSTFNGSYVLQGRLAFGSAAIGGTTFTPSGTCNTVGATTTTTTTTTTAGTTTSTDATTTTTTSSTTSSSTTTTSSTTSSSTSSSTSSTSSTTGGSTTTTSTLPEITTTTVALPTTTTVVYQNTAALEAIQSTFVTQLATVTAPSTQQVQDINAFVSSGLATIKANVAPVSTVIGLLDLLGDSIAKQGDQVPNSATAVSLNLVTTLVSSVNTAALTPTEKSDMLSKVSAAVVSTATSVESKTNIKPEELSANLASMGQALVAASTALNGGVVSSAFVSVAADLAAAAEAITAAQTGNNPADVGAKVEAAKVVLAKAVARILGKAILSGDGPTVVGLSAATVVNGLDPGGLSVEVKPGQIANGLSSLVAALNISGSTATYVTATGVTEIQAGTRFVPAFLVESALVSSNIPEGIIVNANGSAIAVKSNLATTYVPTSRDLIGLITALENAGLTATIESDGSLNLVTPTGGRFAGTFGFTDVKKGTLTTAPVTFTQPSGDPKTTNYFYTVNYSDGSSQRVAPYVAADGFYNSLAALKFSIRTDRSTGVIVGPGNIRYRPSYFVQANTAADLVYHGAARDRFDISYRKADVNGDGLADYEVITSSGKQVLYRME